MNELRDLLRHIIIDNHGFLRNEDVEKLAGLDRLRQLLVRCGNGRMLVAAQSVLHFCVIVDASGVDHVRDISLPASDRAYSGDYQPISKLNGREPASPNHAADYSDEAKQVQGSYRYERDEFGGAFDGFNVTSDADSGL